MHGQLFLRIVAFHGHKGLPLRQRHISRVIQPERDGVIRLRHIMKRNTCLLQIVGISGDQTVCVKGTVFPCRKNIFCGIPGVAVLLAVPQGGRDRTCRIEKYGELSPREQDTVLVAVPFGQLQAVPGCDIEIDGRIGLGGAPLEIVHFQLVVAGQNRIGELSSCDPAAGDIAEDTVLVILQTASCSAVSLRCRLDGHPLSC